MILTKHQNDKVYVQTVSASDTSVVVDASVQGKPQIKVSNPLPPVSPAVAGRVPRVTADGQGIEYVALPNVAAAPAELTATAPLMGGGSLSQNLTLSMTQAGGTSNGWLSTGHWNLFNNGVSTANAAQIAADSAKTTAATAQTTANTAKTTADAADRTANTANASAANAVNVANTANGSAANAVNVANAANGSAANAVTVANAANSASANAVNVANAANGTANAANGAASAASGLAQTALNTANAKLNANQGLTGWIDFGKPFSSNVGCRIAADPSGALLIQNNEGQLYNYGSKGILLAVGSTLHGVGINNQPSTTHRLNVFGTAYLSSSANWSTGSDRRLKSSVEDADLNRCLEDIRALKLRRFEWKDKEAHPDAHQIGLLADEVEAIWPRAISLDSMDVEGEEINDIKTMDIGQLNMALFGAFQAYVKQTDERFASMQTVIDTLTARLDALATVD
jgi:hypothetical protein